MKDKISSVEIEKVVNYILDDYEGGKFIDNMNLFDKPEKARVVQIVDKLLHIVFPGYFRDKSYKIYNPKHSLAVLTEDIFYRLNKQVRLSLDFAKTNEILSEEERSEQSYQICLEFFRKIPKVRSYVETDLMATLDGDPAAGSYEEIVLAYPGLEASTIARLAHELYLLKVPLLPRLMTEYAHSKTGIDIHPGATIGKYFFIDHGTGIVVGETSEIGKNVKIYQGVTIGALSTRGGQRLSGVKRHPTIEDNVTIYSGASVLGGETVIGRNSVIGGNAFITNSIPPDTRVYIKNQELEIKDGNHKHKSEELKQGKAWFYEI